MLRPSLVHSSYKSLNRLQLRIIHALSHTSSHPQHHPPYYKIICTMLFMNYHIYIMHKYIYSFGTNHFLQVSYLTPSSVLLTLPASTPSPCQPNFYTAFLFSLFSQIHSTKLISPLYNHPLVQHAQFVQRLCSPTSVLQLTAFWRPQFSIFTFLTQSIFFIR